MAQLHDPQQPGRSPPGCVYSSRPLSVQEWRRCVWLESQLGPKSSHLEPDNGVLQDPVAAELDVMSTCPVRPAHESLSRAPSRSLARQLSSTKPVKRASVRIAPLIDLNQPRDASGRPVFADEDERRRRERTRLSINRHHPNTSSPLLSTSPLPNTILKDDQLETRHRAAMRRLQAEAVDQIEHAEMLRQRRMTSSQYQYSSTSPSKVRRSTLLSNSSLEPGQKRQSPTRIDVNHSTTPLNSIITPSPSRSKPLVSNLVRKGSAKVVGVVRSLNNFRRKSIKSPGKSERVEDNSLESCSYIDNKPTGGGVFRRFSTLGFHHSSPHR